DPVARARNDGGADVGADESNLFGLARAEELLRADGENRHVQLPGGEQSFVVARILRERGELLESVVHRVGARIQRRIMPAGRLVDRFRVGRQLIPEAVEIDAPSRPATSRSTSGPRKLKCQSKGLRVMAS